MKSIDWTMAAKSKEQSSLIFVDGNIQSPDLRATRNRVGVLSRLQVRSKYFSSVPSK
jgi:hypothetical protein